MRKNSKQSYNPCGMTVSPTVTNSYHNKALIKPPAITTFFILLAGVFGVLFSMTSTLEVYFDSAFVYMYTVFITLVFFLICYYRKRNQVVVSVCSIILLLVTILIAYKIEYIRSGVFNNFYILLRLFDLDNTDFGRWVYESVVRNYSIYNTYFLLLYTTIVSAFLSFNFIINPNFFVVFVLTIPIFVSNLLFSLLDYGVFVPLLLLFWSCVLSADKARLSSHRKHPHKRKSGKHVVLKSNNPDKLSFHLVVSKSMVFICLIVFSCTYIFKSVTNYERSDMLNQKKVDFILDITNFDINNVGDSITKIFTPNTKIKSNKVNTIGGMSNGRLTNMGDVKLNGNILFKVNITSPMDLYLKSYAAGKYTGSQWAQIDSISSIESLNAYKLLKDQYEILRSLYFYENIIEIDGNIGNELVPYFASPPISSYFVNDSYFKQNSETLEYFYVPEYSYSTLYDELITAFNNSQGFNTGIAIGPYHDFVKNNYLAVPVEMQRLYNDFSIHRNKSLDDKILIVQNYLRQNNTYTLSPKKVAGSSDFIMNFLYDSKQGYCMHFASAGVMMFRSMGVPARYVEGFAIDSYALTFNGANYSKNVTDNYAHAWVEIFVDTIGWIPIEVTPPYTSQHLPTITTNNTTTTKPTTTVSPNTTTKNPQVTTTPPKTNSSKNQSTSSKSTTKNTSASSNNNLFIKGLVVILSTLVILIVSLILRRMLSLKKREREFLNPDLNVAACDIYKHMKKIIMFKSDELNAITDLEVAQRLFQKYDKPNELDDEFFLKGDEELTDSDFLKVTKIALKARMSQHKTTEEEILIATKIFDETLESLKQNIKKTDIFNAKYIYNLY